MRGFGWQAASSLIRCQSLHQRDATAHIKQFLHVPLNVLHAASRADMEQRGRTEVANTPDLKMLLPFVPKCWLIPTREALHASEFPDALRGRDVVVFVHGFRFNLMRVVRTSYALRQLTKDLPCAQSALILSFVWPSHRQRKSYSKARGHACDSAQYFATLLLLLSQLGCSVHVVAHSLGCRVAMAALLELEEARETCVQLKYMALLGGAVAREALEPEGEFPLRRLSAAQIDVFYSQKDSVLLKYFRLGEGVDAFFSTGRTSAMSEALGLRGPVNATMEATAGTAGTSLTAFEVTEEVHAHSAECYILAPTFAKRLARQLCHCEDEEVLGVRRTLTSDLMTETSTELDLGDSDDEHPHRQRAQSSQGPG
ncbi:unnamed protein product [Durusdinium trenchii]|uniref:Uncharacterized protein n=1 Tax=Durusdinium trenchii TaxID=1381693 RepID=A0ABP0Q8B4_9DINO